MDKNQVRSLSVLRAVSLAMAVLSLLVMGRAWQGMRLLGIFTFQLKWALIQMTFGCVALFFGIIFFSTWNEKLRIWFDRLLKKLPRSRVLKTVSVFLFILLITFYTWFFNFAPVAGVFVEIDFLKSILSGGSNQSGIFQWWVFGICGLVAALVLKLGWKEVPIGRALFTGFICEAVVFKIVLLLQGVSSIPFTLSWEEDYRLYYASLFAAKRLYGMSLALSMVDFSLNLLNSIPFLLGNLPIWVHRLWRVVLTLGFPILTGWALVWRLKKKNRLIRWLMVGFVLLYLLQEGGVKYNLLLCVLIVLVGSSPRHPWRTLVSIILASIWAGLSRLNWFPVPAMLGLTLYMLEEPVDGYQNLVRYFVWPALWMVAGIVFAFVSSQVLTILNGLHGFQFASSLNSPLLWYRLLPNATYSLGIVPAVFLASLPLWWICLSSKAKCHPVRWIGLVAMLLVLFAGGLLVSIKIGGGSDLHNLDAYLVMLGILTAYLYSNRYRSEGDASVKAISWLPLALVLFFPLWSAMKIVQPYLPYDRPLVETALQTLQKDVGQASMQGNVLFMYQKELLAFGQVDVPLVPGYESVIVLEMAMSHNSTYLSKFYADLQDHRFSLIVTEPQPGKIQGSTHGFGEENDIYFTEISQPMRCYYKLLESIPDAGVELYVPRPDSGNCSIGMP
jgi:hypothetical protein